MYWAEITDLKHWLVKTNDNCYHVVARQGSGLDQWILYPGAFNAEFAIRQAMLSAASDNPLICAEVFSGTELLPIRQIALFSHKLTWRENRVISSQGENVSLFISPDYKTHYVQHTHDVAAQSIINNDPTMQADFETRGLHSYVDYLLSKGWIRVNTNAIEIGIWDLTVEENLLKYLHSLNADEEVNVEINGRLLFEGSVEEGITKFDQLILRGQDAQNAQNHPQQTEKAQQEGDTSAYPSIETETPQAEITVEDVTELYTSFCEEYGIKPSKIDLQSIQKAIYNVAQGFEGEMAVQYMINVATFCKDTFGKYTYQIALEVGWYFLALNGYTLRGGSYAIEQWLMEYVNNPKGIKPSGEKIDIYEEIKKLIDDHAIPLPEGEGEEKEVSSKIAAPETYTDASDVDQPEFRDLSQWHWEDKTLPFLKDEYPGESEDSIKFPQDPKSRSNTELDNYPNQAYNGVTAQNLAWKEASDLPKAEDIIFYDYGPETTINQYPSRRKDNQDLKKRKTKENEELLFEKGLHQTVDRPETQREITPYSNKLTYIENKVAFKLSWKEPSENTLRKEEITRLNQILIDAQSRDWVYWNPDYYVNADGIGTLTPRDDARTELTINFHTVASNYVVVLSKLTSQDFAEYKSEGWQFIAANNYEEIKEAVESLKQYYRNYHNTRPEDVVLSWKEPSENTLDYETVLHINKSLEEAADGEWEYVPGEFVLKNGARPGRLFSSSREVFIEGYYRAYNNVIIELIGSATDSYGAEIEEVRAIRTVKISEISAAIAELKKEFQQEQTVIASQNSLFMYIKPGTDFPIDAKTPHVTICYLKTTVFNKDRQNIINKIAHLLKQYSRPRCSFTGTAVFDDENKSKVILVNFEKGADLYTNILNVLEDYIDIDRVKEYDFIPHLTIDKTLTITNLPEYSWEPNCMYIEFERNVPAIEIEFGTGKVRESENLDKTSNTAIEKIAWEYSALDKILQSNIGDIWVYPGSDYHIALIPTSAVKEIGKDVQFSGYEIFIPKFVAEYSLGIIRAKISTGESLVKERTYETNNFLKIKLHYLGNLNEWLSTTVKRGWQEPSTGKQVLPARGNIYEVNNHVKKYALVLAVYGRIGQYVNLLIVRDTSLEDLSYKTGAHFIGNTLGEDILINLEELQDWKHVGTNKHLSEWLR